MPIIVDPSHGTGQRYLIEPMAKAGLVVGADGIMIEVHHDPEMLCLMVNKVYLSLCLRKLWDVLISLITDYIMKRLVCQ